MVRQSLHSKATPPRSRKHAAMERTRAQIVAGAQVVLAELGPSATIDQVAKASTIATSTIYLHFSDREALFTEALANAHHAWERWAISTVSAIPEELERFVAISRLFVRAGITHPTYGKMIAHSVGMIASQIPRFTQQITAHIITLEREGEVSANQLPLRSEAFATCLFGALVSQLRRTNAKRADNAIEIALSLLEIEPRKARKLAHQPLPKMKRVL
jgi:AcrR family transcriptional regulator